MRTFNKSSWVAGKRGKTRENAGDQFVIGFGVVSDWFREWHEFFCTNHKAS